MKKWIVFFIFISFLFLFTSCNDSKKKGKTSEPAKTAGQVTTIAPTQASQEETVEKSKQSTAVEPTQPAKAEVTGTPGQSAEPEPEPEPEQKQAPELNPEDWVDTGLTLEAIKKAAQDLGYSVEAINERQMSNEPKPTDGFNLIYEDDYSYSNIPILEFKDVNDARMYAKLINEKGYHLCIVNGKYLTMTNALYGVNLNDNETKLLETLLESTLMKYEEAGPAPFMPASDFAGAYLQRDTIYKALDKLVNKSVILHDKAASEETRISASFVTFTLLSSGDLSFVSNLSEDQAQLDAIVKLWEKFGVKDMKLKHDTAHDYVLTGSRMGLDTAFEIHCSFDPGTGALRLIDEDGGEVLEFYEYVPLGADKYAFQTLYERAIVEYRDGSILSFVYSLNKREKVFAYHPDTDGIYATSGIADVAWVSKDGEDNYDQFISYDGTTLKIAADSFVGGRLKIDLIP